MAIIQPQPLHIVEVYIDESSTRHRYLVLGAIVTPSANIAEFTDMLRAARLPELPYSEMKWTKVSTSKLGAYIRFILFATTRQFRFSFGDCGYVAATTS